MFLKNNILLQDDKGHARKKALPSNLKPQGLALIWHFCSRHLSQDTVAGEALACIAFGRRLRGRCTAESFAP